MVKKKVEKGEKRDKAGKWQKGTKGGPGRRKGEPRDIICKDGKKRSAGTLVDDLLAAYETLGGPKFLKQWAAHSHRNLAKFVELLYKFAPMPTIESSVEFKPLTIQVQKLPETDAYKLLERDLRQLRDDNREMSLELSRMRSIFSSHNIEYTEISHEVIRDKELPGHEDEADEEDHSDRRYK